MAEYSEATTLNPTLTYPTGSTGLNVMAAVYDTLLRFDPETKTVVPQMAESFESNEDFTVWTLGLRPDVQFTDGTPLDADAVVSSIEYYIANFGLNGNLIQANLESMEATDESTVVFTFKNPWASFPNIMAAGPGLVMAPASYDDPKNFEPIGAGPFVLESMAPGEKTVVTANEDYFAGRPHLDAIEFVQVATDQAKVDSLRAGGVDVVYLTQEEPIMKLVNEGFPASMHAVSGVPILTLNMREGAPTADVRVRRAISLAIDAGTFLKRNTGSAALADRGLMSPRSDWRTDVEPVEADVEKAKALLAEAKADGYDGKIRYLGQSNADAKAGAVAIKGMLESVGFDVTLDFSRTVQEQVKKIYVDGDFDIARSSLSITDADPYAGLHQGLHSASAVNAGRYANPKMDKLLVELQGAEDAESGLATMTAIEELWKKDVPYINLGHGGFLNAWAKDVHGILPTTNTAVLFHEAWIEQD